ncbi:zinc finger protein CONSTANS-LIKE 10-like [Abrus precatorius]|uniref:Zinc finger protein CONSTANS-LIKE 10-like n=1 Tax=Abrus precatorius TaxID=3816 RepID=A0A8B8M227_ABRPR|nr:zinc finger protein CONSTANS-LIKE 10-like [Abrus precatorius]
MSSHLYALDISFHTLSSPDYDDGSGQLVFFSDPFLTTSPIDVPLGSFDNSLNPFSFSPPENKLLYQTNHSSGSNIKGESRNFAAFDGPEVISEECQMGVDYTFNQHIISQSGSMQRSFSCNSFDGKPSFPTLMDFPNFQWHALNSPENTFVSGEMRRVCSTGDLQNMKATDMSHTESPFLEEANFKVGRYSAEERKERISKYRAKRSQRKFNKIIKYACRKTLADNRTRIRGRFARNDDTIEIPIPKAPCATTEEYEDEFWVEFIDGLNDEPLG